MLFQQLLRGLPRRKNEMSKHSSSATLHNTGQDICTAPSPMGGEPTFHTGIGGLKHKWIVAIIRPINLFLDDINFPKCSEEQGLFVFFLIWRIDYSCSLNFIMSQKHYGRRWQSQTNKNETNKRLKAVIHLSISIPFFRFHWLLWPVPCVYWNWMIKKPREKKEYLKQFF